MRRLVFVTALALSGCAGMFEESPEEAARRAEAQRRAGLPVALASCAELDRRAEDAQAAIDGELRAQAEAERREEMLRGLTPRGVPSPPSVVRAPRSMAREYAEVAVLTAEMARRC